MVFDLIKFEINCDVIDANDYILMSLQHSQNFRCKKANCGSQKN